MTLTSILILTQYVVLSLAVMIAVAFFSLMERKILSLMHYRVGPDKVSLAGILQPIADAMKLLTKDDHPVIWSNLLLYYTAPVLMFCVSLSTFVIYPFLSGGGAALSMVILMIFLGMTVYGTLISGWSSNSKYALIGSVRSVSQSLSYEVVFSFFLLTVVAVMASYSLSKFSDMGMTMMSVMSPFMFGMFLIVVLAELNRTPFDLSEGESELVSGYSVEYGGVMYTILFLSENISIFVSCLMINLFFFTSNTLVLPVLWAIWSFIVCAIRGTLPRLRYDMLMYLCWLTVLPCVLLGFNAMLVVVALVLSHSSLIWQINVLLMN